MLRAELVRPDVPERALRLTWRVFVVNLLGEGAIPGCAARDQSVDTRCGPAVLRAQ